MKYLPLLLLLLSCQTSQKELVFTPKKFESKGFYSPVASYEFSRIINDSILANRGPQLAALHHCFVENHKSALESWDIQFNEKRDPLPASKANRFKQFRSEAAVPYILKKATEHQVTIINEAHHIAQHRVFTTRLLEDLYKQGYRHLGLESYSPGDDAKKHLKENGYPLLSGGFTIEPQFGHMIRTAHQIGFQVFGYDAYGTGSIKMREIKQARNIQQYMTEHPEGKVLIHCGYFHGYEGEMTDKWEIAMAARLTEFTGIDPFTINQTIFTEKSQKQFEHPYYQLTDVKEPTIYFDTDNNLLSDYEKGGWFDLSVFHPRSGNQERPEWLIYDNRKRVQLDLNQANTTFPCLVLAFANGEKFDLAIPYDLQETKDKKVTLVLEPGQYDILLWDENEMTIMTSIEVD